MKTTILSTLLCLLFLGASNAQTPVDTLVNSRGKRVVLMSDNTWHYVGEKKVSSRNVYGIKGTPIKKKRKKESSYDYSSYSSSGYCGATTKRGGACRRRVKGGGYCWQHR